MTLTMRDKIERGHPIKLFSPDLEDAGRELASQIVESIRNSKVIRADNVYRYLHEQAGKDLLDWDWNRDFPSLTPPFPKTWIETEPPLGGRHLGEFVKYPQHYPKRWAVLAETFESDGMTLGGGKPNLSDDPKWDLRLWLFLDLGPFVWGPVGGTQFFLNDQGDPILPIDGGIPRWYFIESNEEWSGFALAHLNNFMCGSLLTLSFLNCRNVVCSERHPNRRDVREAKRRDQPLPTKYYTLEIDPMKSTLRNEGRLSEVGFKKALHICRGHFVTYCPDRPLFGKYTGRFWRPSHIRGTSESGRVIKDYSVISPASRLA